MCGYVPQDVPTPANLTPGLAIGGPAKRTHTARSKVLVEFNCKSVGTVFAYLGDCDEGPTLEVKILKGADARS